MEFILDTVSQLIKKINDLRTQNTDLQSHNAELLLEINGLRTQNTDLQSHNAELLLEIENLKATNDELNATIMEYRRQSEIENWTDSIAKIQNI
jgi:uncharacterized coiled-coil DUF342 family protein